MKRYYFVRRITNASGWQEYSVIASSDLGEPEMSCEPEELEQ